MVTEAKKDAATQAYILGMKAFKQKNFDRAEKYLKKSIKYHPTREAQHLLSNIATLRAKQQRYRKQQRTSTPQYKPPKQQKASATVTDPEVRRIINEKDYYAMFGVDRNFREVKNLDKKYRQLAKKFHPDINKKPGAEDAFKKIASAYECLKDPSKRRIYDQYGDDAPELRQSSSQFHQMHPEDIIRMFGFKRHFRGKGDDSTGDDQNFLGPLMSFLPLLVILGYSFLSNPTYDKPDPFSLQKSLEFPIAREHTDEDIQFYVSRRFARTTQTRPNYLREVEDLVEGRYLENLHEACKQERKLKQHRIQDASKSRGENMVKDLKTAYELNEPSCDVYEDYIRSKQKSFF